MALCGFCSADAQSGGGGHSELCEVQRRVYDLTGSAHRVIRRGRHATTTVEVLAVLDSLADSAGRLVELVREGDTVEAVEAAAAVDLPDILDHFAAVHPGVAVTARVWWDVPYRHDAELVDGVLVVDTCSDRAGESVGDDEVWCGECDQVLSVDSIEVDYA